MYLEHLNTADPSTMTFQQIIELYNNNFNMLRNFIVTLGDKYVVENFSNSTDKVIQLEHQYNPTKNNLFVLINGVLQQLDKDYTEVSTTSIELASDRDYDDEIKVVIIQSNLLQVSVEEYVNELYQLVSNTKSSLEVAKSLVSEGTLIQETIKSYYDSVDRIYFASLALSDELNNLKKDSDSNLVVYNSMLQEMSSLKNSIDALSLLTPEQIEGTEVVQARKGFPILGERLDKMIYQFDTVEDMKLCRALSSGDRCLTFGKTQMGDDSTKIYKIVPPNEVPSDIDEVYLLGNGMMAYLMSIFSGIGGGSGGSGGGGGATGSITLTAIGDTNLTVVKGSSVILSYMFENNLGSTGTANYYVNDVSKSVQTISKGQVNIDIGPYLKEGSNVIDISVTDRYGSRGILSYTINAIALSLTSTFDDTVSYSSNITYKFIPYGNIYKTIHFLVDESELDPISTNASGQQSTKIIPAMSHGVHRLEVYMTATVGDIEVKSASLIYDIMCVESGNTTPMIASVIDFTESVQGKQLSIPYSVLDPTKLACDISLVIYTMNAGERVVYSSTNLTVNRSRNYWNTRDYPLGEVYFAINYGSISKVHKIEVSENDIDISAKTNDLELYLSSANRSNSEPNPGIWSDGEVETTFQNVNWSSTGWVNDEAGDSCLRLNGGATANISFKPFESDLRTYGKTIELEFAIRDVNNRDALVIQCMDGNIGFSVTADTATLNSEQTSVECRYRDEEKVRVAFVIESISENRLLSIYLNGILSCSKQYPTNDNFQQRNPVTISVGSPYCAVDLYTIRSYSTALTSIEATNNYIADTVDLVKKVELYYDNNIYDDYGKVSYASMKERIPVMTIIGDLPQSKGDKKNVIIKYENPNDSSLSFEDSGVIDVQGTSSQWYVVKNFKIKFVAKHKHADGQLSASVFCMKADYAEATGTHNTQNANLIHTLYSEKTPAQEVDAKCRTTIYGYPCVIFHQKDESAEPEFVGKYNFNFDKGSENVFGFTNSFDVESWEFLNNTSDACNFKGEVPDDWGDDFEARYPEDSDAINRFKTMHSWVVSTRQDAATGDALPESVSYDGVTYSNDTSEYRLAKFKNEFENHFDLHFALIYYVYTFVMLMVDQRAKNMFLTYWASTGKWQPWFYDNDTCLGINNEGQLVFDYYHEDTDQIDGANVYNGQNSVLWNNFRLAFPDKIKTTYQNLRNSGMITYDVFVDYFLNRGSHQWSASIYNEDSEFKYISMLRSSGDATNLPQIRGSGEEHFKYFVENRLNYCDSKWYASDYANDYVSLRIYTPSGEQAIEPNASITVVPYSDMYAGVRYKANGSLLQSRAKKNVPVIFNAPDETFNDTETAIYGASQLSSLGDLAPLYCGSINVSKAVKLIELKVGDATEGYSNNYLNSLSVGTNKLLKKIDIRNCPSLVDPLVLSGCPNIEEIYASGSGITGLELGNSGYLKVIHLPSTLINLTLMNQLYIEDLSIEGYSAIKTLRIENCPNINTLDLLQNCTNLERARISGIDWSFDDASYLLSLGSIGGLDENGLNTEIISLIGKCHIKSLSGSEMAQLNEAYPYLTITYDNLTSQLIFMSEDGSLEYTRQTIVNGADGTSPSITPTKSSTAQYNYTFSGWSLTPGGSASSDALKAVSSDRYVYAAFTATIRSYTVKFYNDSTLLQTSTVNYGSSATYTGTTPVKSGVDNPDFYEFRGWSPSPSNITGNTNCYAQYAFIGYIEDSWATIKANVENGTFISKYNIGALKQVELTYSDGTTETIDLELVGINHDDLADGTGEAGLTFLCKDLLATSKVMNSSATNSGGWGSSAMRTYCNDTLYNALPSDLQAVIEEVNKLSDGGQADPTLKTTVDKIWIPSTAEVNLDPSYDVDGQGEAYSVFTDSTSRKKYKVGATSSSGWWLRSASTDGSSDFYFVGGINGSGYSSNANSATGVCFGFCVGKSPYIGDSWQEILASIDDGSYATKYRVGMLKELDLGSEGVVNMQLVAMDADNLSDGSGTAPMTFLTKELLNTSKRMNPTLVSNDDGTYQLGTGSIGGWEHSEIRSYLQNTIANLIPTEVFSRIAEVSKTSGSYNTAGTFSKDNITADKLWLPSRRELFNSSNYETTGPAYSSVFTTYNSRIKYKVGATSSNFWWLRSAHTEDRYYFCNIDRSGGSYSVTAGYSSGVCFGFCLK